MSSKSSFHLSFFTTFEALIVFAALGVFVAQWPDRIRTELWEDGAINGFNSDPTLRIYYYANHKTPPDVPFIWTQTLTDSNMAVAIMTLCVFVASILLRFFEVVSRWTHAYLYCCVGISWVFSVVAQLGADYSDMEHPSAVPWYISHNCNASQKSQSCCRLAQASFVTAIIMSCFYLAMTLWCLAEIFWIRKIQMISSSDKQYYLEQIPAAKDDGGSPLEEEGFLATWESERRRSSWWM